MPVSAGGKNQSVKPGSESGGNAVELVISARNEAKEALADIERSLDSVKKKAEDVADGFEEFSGKTEDSFKSLRQDLSDLANAVLPKLQQSLVLTSKSFSAVAGAAQSTFNVLGKATELIEDFYEIASSDVSVAVFSAFISMADTAISKGAKLSSIIEDIAGKDALSRKFAQGFGGAQQIDSAYKTFEKVLPVLDDFTGRMKRVSDTTTNVTTRVLSSSDSLANFVGAVAKVDQPLAIFSTAQQVVSGVAGSIAQASQNIFFFVEALEQLQAIVVGGPFELLLGQNIRLQEQMLATQATLTAISQFKFEGQSVEDPSASILGLAAPVNSVINQIRKDSLEIVGSTSNELIDVFGIVTQSLTDVNISLREAGQLTSDFAASLGTIGVPLYQARQEIQSILTGQIDYNSVLANSIGLNNSQLRLWIAQGNVYERLSERLSAFREGNSLAAETVGGLTSNIKEIFQEIGRSAGGKYLDPLEKQIGSLYRTLIDNQEPLTETISDFLDRFVSAFSKVEKALLSFGKAIAPLAQEIGRFLAQSSVAAIEGLAAGFQTLSVVATPFLEILGQLSKLIASNPLLPLFVQLKVLSSAFQIGAQFFSNYVNIFPLLSQGLSLVDKAGNPLLNTFSNLSRAFGGNIGSVITLGATLSKLPIFMGFATKQAEKFTDVIVNTAKGSKLIAGLEQLPLLGKPLAGLTKNTNVIGFFTKAIANASPAIFNFAKSGLALADFFNLDRAGIIEKLRDLPGTLSKVRQNFFDKTTLDLFGRKLNLGEVIAKNIPSAIKGALAVIPPIDLGDGKILNLADAFEAQAAKVKPAIQDLGENAEKQFQSLDEKIAEFTKNAGEQAKNMTLRYGLWAAATFMVATAFNELILKNEDLRLAVEFITDKIKEFADIIGGVLFSKIGIVTQAIVGMALLIKLGIIGTLKEAAKSFLLAFSPQLVAAMKVEIAFIQGLIPRIVLALQAVKKAVLEAFAIEKLTAFGTAIKGFVLASIANVRNTIRGLSLSLKELNITTIASSFNSFFVSIGTSLTAAWKGVAALSAGLYNSLVAALTSVGLAAEAAGAAMLKMIAKNLPLLAVAATIGIIISKALEWAALEARRNEKLKEYRKELSEVITFLEKRNKLEAGVTNPSFTPRTREEQIAFEKNGETGVRQIRQADADRNGLERGYAGLMAGVFGSTGETRKVEADVTANDRLFTQLREDLSKYFSASDNGLTAETIADIRKNQELTGKVAELNRLGREGEARTLQGKLEESNRNLDSIEQFFVAQRDKLEGLDVSGEQAKERDAILYKLNETLNNFYGLRDGTIAPAKPIQLGTALSQTLSQYENAKALYAQGGLPDQQQRYASLLVGSASSLAQKGQLDIETAIEDVKRIAESTTLDTDTVQSAQDQLVQLRQIATQRLLQVEENYQGELDLLRQQGLLSEIQYQEESLKVTERRYAKQRKASLDAQAELLQVTRNQQARQLQIIEDEYATQAAAIDQQIGQAKTPEERAKLEESKQKGRQDADRQRLALIEATESQIQQLRLDYEKEFTTLAIEEEKSRQEALLQIVATKQERLNDILAYSEEVRNTELTRITNEGLLFEEEANLLRIASSDRRIAREIEAETARRDEMLKTPALYEKEISQSYIKIQQLTQQRVENEGKAWDAQLAALRRNLKYQVEAFVNAREEENKSIIGQQKYFEAMDRVMSRRSELFSSAKGLLSDTSSSIDSLFQGLAGAVVPDTQSQRLQSIGELSKLEMLQKSLDLERKMFATQEAQNRLALERQKIELTMMQIEQERLLLEESANLRAAQIEAQAKPGDRQAQLNLDIAQRTVDALKASYELIFTEKEVLDAQIKLNDKTAQTRLENNERNLSAAIVSQINTVKQTLPTAIQAGQYPKILEAQLRAAGIDPESAKRLSGSMPELERALLEQQARGIRSALGEPLTKQGIIDDPSELGQASILNIPSTRLEQQQANILQAQRGGLNLIGVGSLEGDAARVNQLSALDLNRIGDKSLLPGQSAGQVVDVVSEALDVEPVKRFNKATDELARGSIPTLEQMLQTSDDIISGKFPVLQEQLKTISEEQMPTAESVLTSLGDRIDQFAEEDLPGMQLALEGLQGKAVNVIEVLAEQVEASAEELAVNIGAKFKAAWEDLLLNAPAPNVAPGSGTAKVEEKVGASAGVKSKAQLDSEARQMEIQGLEAQIKTEGAIVVADGSHDKKQAERRSAMEGRIAQLQAAEREYQNSLSTEQKQAIIWRREAEQMAENGRNITTALSKGMDDGRPGVVRSVVGAADAIKRSLTGAFQIQSPSRWAIGVGKNVVAGLEEGLKDSSGVERAIVGVADDTKKALASRFSGQRWMAAVPVLAPRNAALPGSAGTTNNQSTINQTISFRIDGAKDPRAVGTQVRQELDNLMKTAQAYQRV